MEKKQTEDNLLNEEVTEKETPAFQTPAPEEEHSHGNYIFALKVLAVLVGIIIVIVILKASGVPIAIKDWISKAVQSAALVWPSLHF